MQILQIAFWFILSYFFTKILSKEKDFFEKFKAAKKAGPNSSAFFILIKLLLSVNSSHVLDQLEDLVGVTPLVVVPGNEFDKGLC